MEARPPELVATGLAAVLPAVLAEAAPAVAELEAVPLEGALAGLPVAAQPAASAATPMPMMDAATCLLVEIRITLTTLPGSIRLDAKA